MASSVFYDDENEHDDSSQRVGIVTHTVTKEELQPGDHIYCYRLGGSYAHHGIYIGEPDCEVIHFNSQEPLLALQEIAQAKMEEYLSSAIALQDNYEKMQAGQPEKITKDLKTSPAFGIAKDAFRKQRINAVGQQICIQSCTLEEFLAKSVKIRLVSYNASSVTKVLKRSQTCHIMEAMPPVETIKVAKHFCEHPEEWGDYNLLGDNNCETFACFCKTGLLDVSAQAQRKRGAKYEKEKVSYKTYEEALENYKEIKSVTADKEISAKLKLRFVSEN